MFVRLVFPSWILRRLWQDDDALFSNAILFADDVQHWKSPVIWDGWNRRVISSNDEIAPQATIVDEDGLVPTSPWQIGRAHV